METDGVDLGPIYSSAGLKEETEWVYLGPIYSSCPGPAGLKEETEWVYLGPIYSSCPGPAALKEETEWVYLGSIYSSCTVFRNCSHFHLYAMCMLLYLNLLNIRCLLVLKSICT